MRPDLRQIGIAGTRKSGNSASQRLPSWAVKDKQSAYRFISGRRHWQALQREKAEARRVGLKRWQDLKRGDIHAQAKALGLWDSTICRDYQILRAREFDRVATLKGLIDTLQALRKPPQSP